MRINSILTLFITIPVLAFGQIKIHNANFEEYSDSSNTKLLKWTGAGGTNIIVDSTEVFAGKYSLKMNRAEATGKSSFFQELPFTCNALKKYKITCAIKTTNLKGKAGLGARIFDKDGNSITGYNAFSISTDHTWQIMEGEFYADEKAVSIRIFGNMEGSGNACFDNIQVTEKPVAKSKPGAQVQKYIDEYFHYLHQYSIVRDSLYLHTLKVNTEKLCAGHDQAYCQNILKRYTTLKLNDGHSFFWTTDEWKQYNTGSSNTILSGLVNYATGHLTNDSVAYINVATFASLDSNITHKYVDSLQSIIKALDNQNPKGWIIDLSKNEGGNSFAMLPGLGPLLGNGICGYSQSADGSKRTRVYNNGYAGWFPDTTFLQKTPVYRLVHSNLPIAIIYSNRTGSSGEVTAISFRGKENTKSFGQETWGATTRVDNLEMSDGASLNLACGWDADRTGKVYKTRVPPDVQTPTYEEALQEAGKWIVSYK